MRVAATAEGWSRAPQNRTWGPIKTTIARGPHVEAAQVVVASSTVTAPRPETATNSGAVETRCCRGEIRSPTSPSISATQKAEPALLIFVAAPSMRPKVGFAAKP